MANKSLKQQWQSLTPKSRMYVAGGAGGGLLLVIALALAPAEPVVIGPKQKVQITTLNNLGLPGAAGHDLTIEKLSATVEAVQKDNNALQATVEQDKKNASIEKPAEVGANAETVRELAALRAEVADMKAKQEKAPSLDEALPAGAAYTQGGDNDGSKYPMEVTPEVKKETPRLRVIVGDARKDTSQEDAAPEVKPTVFIPAGSQFDGVLLNGLDAPTSGIAKQHPVPSVMRIKTDAILPNRYRYDVKECFAMISGFGELSTERVQFRTVVLSCIRNDGGVIEAKIEGYVVGEDGRLGMRGRLISKQGQIIAKSFVAGFFSGIGQAMAPVSVPQLNTNPGGTQQVQTPNIGALTTAGTARGIADSSRQISQFYMDMAREMTPVVEVDANRHATIILEKGVEMSLLGEKSANASGFFGVDK